MIETWLTTKYVGLTPTTCPEPIVFPYGDDGKTHGYSSGTQLYIAKEAPIEEANE